MLLLAFVFACTTLSFATTPLQSGDRVAIVGNTYADQLRLHGYLETLLLQRTSGNEISIRNLGWGGDTLTVRDRPTNFVSEKDTLSEHKTDLIIACFGMGESFDGIDGIGEFKKNLKAFLASHRGMKYNGNSLVRLVLVSPIAQEDLGTSTPKTDQRNEEIKAYALAMEQICSQEKIPFINLYEVTATLLGDGKSARLTENGIRLNEYGYWATARTMADFLIRPTPSWILKINAKTLEWEGKGLSIDGIDSDDKEFRFSFSVLEKTPPQLPPPVSGQIHLALQSTRDLMIVKDLPPGEYLLQIDDLDVALGSHVEWSDGLPVDKSPAHQEAEAFRMKVNDKNLHFTYSWKALNQVHIVGERKKSPAGAALPDEVVRFNELTILRDAELRETRSPKTRKWQLIRQ
jgi:hypothetical protein